MVHVSTASIPDRTQNNSIVQTQSVECDVEEEPRTCSTEKDLAVFPLAIVPPKVSPAGFGRIKAHASILESGGTIDLVGMPFRSALDISLDVFAGLVDVTSDVKRVAGGLGDGKPEIEGDAAGHSTEADDYTPHLISSKLTHARTCGRIFRSFK